MNFSFVIVRPSLRWIRIMPTMHRCIRLRGRNPHSNL